MNIKQFFTTHKKQLALALLLLIMLFLLIELLLRPRVLSQALAETLYKLKQYKQAESIYSKNAEKETATSNANLAKSLYKQERFADAAVAADSSLSARQKAGVFYDRGNAAYKQQDYEKAVDYYRKALLANPNDADTKANYELALRKQQNQPPPPKPKPDEKKQEEIRNILGGLDNKESSDRQQEKGQGNYRNSKWW